jgi:thiol:disulfide interchange protein
VEPEARVEEPPATIDDRPAVAEDPAVATSSVDLPAEGTAPAPEADGPLGATGLSLDAEERTEGADAVEERPRARRRTVPRLPPLAATTAAVAVGAVVGLLGCVLTFLGLKLCELVAGTSSCGGPGLLVLILIVVLMILAVEDAGNLSFLGVGITVAAVLIFLLNYLYQPWMFVVMPALTALAFAVARWITTRYVEDVLADDDESEMHDVR